MAPLIMGDEVTMEDVMEADALEATAAGPIGNFNEIGVNFDAVALELIEPDPLNPD